MTAGKKKLKRKRIEPQGSVKKWKNTVGIREIVDVFDAKVKC